MGRFIILILTAVLQTAIFGGSAAGQESYDNRIYDPGIRTVQLYKEGWNLSYPVISLNTSEKLVFQFDLTGNNDEAFSYTFIHCNKDWERSDIFTTDYLDGFPDNPIEDVRPSFNTTVSYTHYTLAFPNERTNLRISGNYILYVYRSDKPDKPSITRRFIVAENAAKASIIIHRTLAATDSDNSQQAEFTVDITGAGVIDAYRNIYATLLQNGRWDNSKSNLKPDIYGGNELKFNSLSGKNIFRGGNEYRYFDVRSIRHLSEFVRQIDFMPPYYNAYLAPSDNREFKPYFYVQDFNGKYYIATQEGRNPETDADYLYVYFTLPSKYKVEGGEMYISGALTDWSFSKDNIMTYNPGPGQYECTLLLKQGWYNYEYVFLKNGEKSAPPSRFEGSHYETENDYMAVVYYRDPRGRYDRVLGTGSMNTLNRISY